MPSKSPKADICKFVSSTIGFDVPVEEKVKAFGRLWNRKHEADIQK